MLSFEFGSTVNAQRLDTPRVPPVQKAEWTDAQRALLQPLEESGDFAFDGQLINVLTTVANHPLLARDFLPIAKRWKPRMSRGSSTGISSSQHQARTRVDSDDHAPS